MNLLNMINPSIAINLIRSQIKKQLKKEINNFDVLYLIDQDILYFIIDGIKYEFPSETLKTLIISQTKNQLKNNDILTAVELCIKKNNEINAKIYMIKEGKKLAINHKLN